MVKVKLYVKHEYKAFTTQHHQLSGRKEMFYLTTQSTHFIYGYMASDIWLRPILIVRKETRCRHIGYSFRLTARVLLYAPSHIQDSTYYGLCYTSRGALAGTRTTNFRSNPPPPPHENISNYNNPFAISLVRFSNRAVVLL